VSYERLDLASLVPLLGGTFVGNAGFEGYSLPQTSDNIFAALLDQEADPDNSVPYAYLNYIIYDEGMNVIDTDAARVPVEAGSESAALNLPGNEPIEIGFQSPISIPQNGYIYIWLSNESKNTRVWFDDLTITHTQNLVVQASDYGVWGDVLREQKSDTKKYRFGYQGQFAEKDDETGWNHFELREYDPVVGRFTMMDPMREFFSGYVGLANNPISGIDPNGGDVIILSAPQGAGGKGHGAMLVGNDQTGWTYVTKDGTDWWPGAIGPGSDLNKADAKAPVFNTLQDFLCSDYNLDHDNPGLSRYHLGIRFESDPEKDAEIIKQGRKGAESLYWVVGFGANCMENCLSPMVDQGMIPAKYGNVSVPNEDIVRLLRFVVKDYSESYLSNRLGFLPFHLFTEKLRDGYGTGGPVIQWADWERHKTSYVAGTRE
jgi:RHS repeat-associated protein